MVSKNKNKQQAPCLAIMGTGSDVGKSIITTALCRYFVQQDIRVAPYKAQNMSNNSGVTAEGLEMGRAQIVQAEAARIPPHVDMNPILLKPTSEIGSQVVLLGNVALRRNLRDKLTRHALHWDGEKMEITNLPEANQYLRREYRKGWALEEV